MAESGGSKGRSCPMLTVLPEIRASRSDGGAPADQHNPRSTAVKNRSNTSDVLCKPKVAAKTVGSTAAVSSAIASSLALFRSAVTVAGPAIPAADQLLAT